MQYSVSKKGVQDIQKNIIWQIRDAKVDPARLWVYHTGNFGYSDLMKSIVYFIYSSTSV